MKSVLFVCFANICRSPALHAVFDKHVKENNLTDSYYIDSAGISGNYGQEVDPRIQKELKSENIHFSHTSRIIAFEDFDIFDHILGVTKHITEELKEISPQHEKKVELVTNFSSVFKSKDISDPYYGGEEGFKRTIEMSKDCCKGFFDAFNS